MTRVLVIHYDKAARTILEAMTRRRFEMASAKNVEAGVKVLRKNRPDVIVIGQDSAKQEAARLLRFFKDNGIRIPVVVMAGRGAGIFQQQLMKLGARGFVEYPVDQDVFESAIERSLAAPDEQTSDDKPRDDAPSKVPPITQEELDANLSLLEQALNRKMKCVAGKNQVYIRSLLTGGGKRKPRICLKCPLRAEYGLVREVYFEYIRDVCCKEPTKCAAVRMFQAARRKTG